LERSCCGQSTFTSIAKTNVPDKKHIVKEMNS
jgi:hypothetical protein